MNFFFFFFTEALIFFIYKLKDRNVSTCSYYEELSLEFVIVIMMFNCKPDERMMLLLKLFSFQFVVRFVVFCVARYFYYIIFYYILFYYNILLFLFLPFLFLLYSIVWCVSLFIDVHVLLFISLL